MQRKELMHERFPLPSRYWEPQPDEEDLERMRQVYEVMRQEYEMDDEPLPFE